MIGIALGSLLGFVLARRFGRPLLTRFVGPQAVARLDDLVERGGAYFFFLLWLLPFVPDDLVCLAAGLTPMSTRQFLLLMVVGRTPGILVATWLGANAAQVSPAWWGVGLGGLVVVAFVLWRWGECDPGEHSWCRPEPLRAAAALGSATPYRPSILVWQIRSAVLYCAASRELGVNVIS